MLAPPEAPGAIAALRQRLLEARRSGDRDAVASLIQDVETLARHGYRCCLVDFEHEKPDYYVRLRGFQSSRVEAELEFPIDPGVQPVQLVPLSHLVDYEEAQPEHIRSIYQQLSPYLHCRRARLTNDAPGRAAQTVARSEHRRERAARSMVIWWTLAGLLFMLSLAALIIL